VKYIRIVAQRLLVVLGLMLSLAYADCLSDSISGLDGGVLDTGSMFSMKYFPSDMSINYLRSVFGTVGSVLIGNSNQLLGQMFAIFNTGLIVFVTAFIGYSMTMTVLHATQEGGGGMSGKGGLNALVILRVTGGVAILVPQWGGYNLMQMMVMWSVMQGVALADHVWVRAVKYAKDYSGIYQPVDLGVRYKKTGDDKITTAFENQKTVLDVTANSLSINQAFITSACMQGQQEELGEAGKVKTRFNQACGSSICPDGSCYDEISGQDKPFTFCFGSEASKAICGTYTAPVDKADAVKQAVTVATYRGITANGGLFTQMRTLVIDLKTGQKNYTDQNCKLNPATCEALYYAESTTKDQIARSFMAMASVYSSRLNLLNQAAAIADPGVEESAWYCAASRFGWLGAGSFYKKLTGTGMKDPVSKKVDDYIAKGTAVVISCPFSAMCAGTKSGGTYVSGAKNKIDALLKGMRGGSISTKDNDATLLGSAKSELRDKAAYAIVDTLKSTSPSLGLNTSSMATSIAIDHIQAEIGRMMTPFFNAFLGMDLNKCVLPSAPSGSAPSGTFANFVANGCIQSTGLGILGGVAATDQGIRVPPMWSLTHAGVTAMTLAVNFFTKSMMWVYDTLVKLTGAYSGIIAAIAVVAGVISSLMSTFMGFAGVMMGDAIQNVAQAGIGVMKMLFSVDKYMLTLYLPLGSAMAMVLFMIGIMLGVYLPFIPVLLFVFAGIGWLISVIEAMVAAPLVALGITHPEGHDLLGRAEQALMLLFSVFLRPVTIIFGFITAIMLLYIAVSMFNESYLYVISDMLIVVKQNASDSAQIIVRWTSFVGMIIIYVYVMMSIVDQCFSLIYVIPDKIMRWIGGPSEQSQVAQMMQQVKGGTEQQMKSGSDAMGKTAEGIGSVGFSAIDAKKMGGGKGGASGGKGGGAEGGGEDGNDSEGDGGGSIDDPV
jgi:conjugal transfer/type IV secretion protein DotA/TraY